VIEVPASQVPRIAPDVLDRERAALGPLYFRQEYECCFEAMRGLVYPDFERWVAGHDPRLEEPRLRVGLSHQPDALARVLRHITGGIDFGFRNPTAALWGGLDAAGVLHLEGEVYASGLTLEEVADRLPKGYLWHGDPSEPEAILRLRRLNRTVCRAKNAIVTGISAVSYRLRHGLLRADPAKCPNLFREAALYHYDEAETHSHEFPLGRDDHAMDALRYLCMGLAHQLPKRTAGNTTFP
jgi:hypothetical protein